MRGDKGIKQGTDLTAGQYFSRAIKLTLPHIPLLLFAIACLFFRSGFRLLMPNYQGKIFDHVIAATVWPFRCSACSLSSLL